MPPSNALRLAAKRFSLAGRSPFEPPPARCILWPVPTPRRIVLTGGPAAGKTSLSAALVAQLADVLVHVPEAATRVYESTGARWNSLDAAGRREIQRAIYRLQLQQEEELARRHPHKVLLLDRGSVDGAAYWPDGPDAYWPALGTTPERELGRYDAVIWLESCAALGLYDGAASNPCRFEDAREAIATGDRLFAAWKRHPRLHSIPAAPELAHKLATARNLLDGLLSPAAPSR